MASFKDSELTDKNELTWSSFAVSGVLRSAQQAGNQSRMWTALAASFVIHVAFLASGINMVGNVYTANLDSSGNPVSTPLATTGVQLWLIGMLVAPLSLGYALLTVAQLRYKVGWGLTTTLCIAITLACTGFAAWSMDVLVQPENTYTTPQPDTLRQTLGGFAVCVYVPLAILGARLVALQCAVTRHKRDTLHEDPPVTCCGRPARHGTFREHQPDSLRANWFGVWIGVWLVVAVVFCGMFLSGVWNYSTTSYTQAFSQYSMLPASWFFVIQNADGNGNPANVVPKLYLDIVVYFSVVLSWLLLGTLATYHAPTRRWANTLIRINGPATKGPSTASSPSCAGLFFNVLSFPIRAVVYLVFTGPWTLISALPLPSSLTLYPQGLHNGEAFILSTFLGLMAWWFWYWSTGYDRIRNEVAKDQDRYAMLHIYARVLGHMTTFFMSFLTFPVTRGGIWEASMGIPFDRAIKYHRVLGRLAWLGVTLHAVLWWVKWYLDGVLINNLTSITNLVVSTGFVNGTTVSVVHDDNFTVPLVESAWLALTLALVFANFSRRASYELFQYTHIAAAFFMFSAMIHAWSHWYYTAVGLILFAFNKIGRTVRSAREVRVEGLSHAGGITRLSIDASVVCTGSRNGDGLYNGHYAGQYVWLHVPGLSAFQWHPFTISSSPAVGGGVGTSLLDSQRTAQGTKAGTIEFLIKDQGPGTWTHALAQLAVAHEAQTVDAVSSGARMPEPRDLCVSVDGPYGRPGRYYDSSVLVLVAGGIGFTPIHSILQDLLLRAVAATEAQIPLWSGTGGTAVSVACAPMGHVRRVHVVWSVRDLETAEAFAATLLAVSNLSKTHSILRSVFTLHLHDTSQRGTGVSSGGARAAAKEGGKRKGKKISTSDEESSAGLLASVYSTEGRGGDSTHGGVVPSPAGAGWVTTEGSAAVHALFAPGRPDLDSIFASAALEAESYGSEGAVSGSGAEVPLFVSCCGPASLNAQVTKLAHAHNAGLHVEVFEF